MDKYQEAEKRGYDDHFKALIYPKDNPYDRARLQDAWHRGQVMARRDDPKLAAAPDAGGL